MARDETWLTKLKSQISLKLTKSSLPNSAKPARVGVLAFEIASLLSKLIALHHSLSDASVVRLLSPLAGVHKLVSDDDSFLLSLAAGEIIDTLRLLSSAVTRLSSRCSDASLRTFSHSLQHFADTGVDFHGWSAGPDLDALVRRAERLISSTSALHREMEELTLLENSLNLKKMKKKDENVLEINQKFVWLKQEVKYVKEKSLWNRTFDFIVLLSSRLIFTILARIKLVFAIGNSDGSAGFFDSRTTAMNHPPENTLGASALSLHYSNLILITEKMIKSPHLVGLDAREDLYSMLPSSIRSSLRSRLKGVGFTATDPGLAGEWRDALSRILHWLAPLAHNMIKWQTERSFEHQNLMPKSNNVLLFQTLFFANRAKTEAAITELLVGLNYIWRFEREMNAKALFQCSNFFSNNNQNLTDIALVK